MRVSLLFLALFALLALSVQAKVNHGRSNYRAPATAPADYGADLAQLEAFQKLLREEQGLPAVEEVPVEVLEVVAVEEKEEQESPLEVADEPLPVVRPSLVSYRAERFAERKAQMKMESRRAASVTSVGSSWGEEDVDVVRSQLRARLSAVHITL